MTTISATTLAEVLAACPYGPPGETPRQIHATVGCWSAVTVRLALGQLVRAGRVAYDGPDSGRRYWRVEA